MTISILQVLALVVGFSTSVFAVPEAGSPADEAHPVEAELVFASVHLRRHRRDGLDRPDAQTEAELLGVVVHELGHALGFPGHLRCGDGVMTQPGQIDAARRWGRAVARGDALRSPTLSELYALRS